MKRIKRIKNLQISGVDEYTECVFFIILKYNNLIFLEEFFQFYATAGFRYFDKNLIEIQIQCTNLTQTMVV